MSYKTYLAVLPCAAFCAGLPLTASAQEQSTGAQSGTHAETAQSGMIVVRDAQTGQLRAPTAAESRALSTAPSASAAMTAPARPTVVTHPGGSKQVKLGERSLVYSVVTRDADGKLHDQCVQGAAAADKALHASAPKHNEEHRHD
jgi:hypothetical protein